MDAAWEQIGRVLEATRRIRFGQLAKEVSYIWYDRHLRPLATVKGEKALLLMAPLNKRVLASEFTVHHHLGQSFVQPTMTSAALRRTLRPRGRWRVSGELQQIGIGAAQGLIASTVFVLFLFIGFCVLFGFFKTKRTAGNRPVVKSLDESLNRQPMSYLAPDAPRGPADQLRAPELLEKTR